jgi:hypothetical protein
VRRRLLAIAVASEIGALLMLAFYLWTQQGLAGYLVLGYILLAGTSIVGGLRV